MPCPRFSTGQMTPNIHCTWGWEGTRSGLDAEARGKIHCRGSNPVCPIVQSVVRHYTDWATSAHVPLDGSAQIATIRYRSIFLNSEIFKTRATLSAAVTHFESKSRTNFFKLEGIAPCHCLLVDVPTITPTIWEHVYDSPRASELWHKTNLYPAVLHSMRFEILTNQHFPHWTEGWYASGGAYWCQQASPVKHQKASCVFNLQALPANPNSQPPRGGPGAMHNGMCSRSEWDGGRVPCALKLETLSTGVSPNRKS
jgi:hypothetical protein